MAGEEFFDASSSPLESSTEAAAGIAVGAVVGIKRFLDPQPSAPAYLNKKNKLAFSESALKEEMYYKEREWRRKEQYLLREIERHKARCERRDRDLNVLEGKLRSMQLRLLKFEQEKKEKESGEGGKDEEREKGRDYRKDKV